VSRTLFLAAVAVIVLAMQFFPDQASHVKRTVIALGILYLAIRALRTYPRQYRDKRIRAAQEAADDREYRQYEIELEAIRAMYAPIHDLDEIAVIPQEYQNDLSALHDRHRAMLDRKFGPG
jgi:hypothetical protein